MRRPGASVARVRAFFVNRNLDRDFDAAFIRSLPFDDSERLYALSWAMLLTIVSVAACLIPASVPYASIRSSRFARSEPAAPIARPPGPGRGDLGPGPTRGPFLKRRSSRPSAPTT